MPGQREPACWLITVEFSSQSYSLLCSNFQLCKQEIHYSSLWWCAYYPRINRFANLRIVTGSSKRYKLYFCMQWTLLKLDIHQTSAIKNIAGMSLLFNSNIKPKPNCLSWNTLIEFLSLLHSLNHSHSYSSLDASSWLVLAWRRHMHHRSRSPGIGVVCVCLCPCVRAWVSITCFSAR